MEAFIDPIIGGVLIGLACVLLLFAIGYPVGISGFLVRVIRDPIAANWRYSFLLGILVMGLAIGSSMPGYLYDGLGLDTFSITLAGALIGVGSRLGGGCTSGHGICGVGRFDVDSIIAIVVFIVAGAATVWMLGA